MKKWILILFLMLIVMLLAYQAGNQSYSNWEIKNNLKSKSDISWVKFEWSGDTLSGTYFEKSAMIVPCKIQGITNVVTFQFDLGCDVTGVYENTYNSIFRNKQINTIKRLKSQIYFWNTATCLENFKLRFGKYLAINDVAYVFDGYGDRIEKYTSKDTIHMGTIGRDVFKDKILIIDYPNQQFAICNRIPPRYANNLISIELDKAGRIILPMHIKSKSYKIMFDTGSSIFPIITANKNISKFSSSPDIDTIRISSWGKKHNVTGKMISDTFEVAGQKFCNEKIYANHSGLGIDDQTDGMTGNALFWNKTILIDFKNKKFGVK